MTPQELIDLANQAAREQLELNRVSLQNQLDASDRIYLRRNAEAVSAAAVELIRTDPTR